MIVPRSGLNTAEVVTAGATLADEIGFGSLTLATLAERLGVKPPALYKHVDGLADLQHRIAALAMSEFGEVLREALQGKAGSSALNATFATWRAYVTAHPGRYAATVGALFHGEDDPLLVASIKVLDSIRAVLAGYGLEPTELDHAIRAVRCTIHGFAVLQTANAFQWAADPDESFAWMTRFVDAGLRALGGEQR